MGDRDKTEGLQVEKCGKLEKCVAGDLLLRGMAGGATVLTGKGCENIWHL